MLLMLIVAVSCRDRPSALPLSDYISAVLSDTSLVEYHIIKEYSSDITGSIAVIGDAADVLPTVETLILFDSFDNIDARSVPDGLADFAGERVDAYFSEPSSFPSVDSVSGNPIPISALSVREFIASLDSSCLYTPFDLSRTERKARAKAVVIASPSFSFQGGHDIDTLCHIAGLGVPVISSVEEMLRFALDNNSQPAKVCLWTTSQRAAAVPYNTLFARIGGRDDGLKVITPEAGESGLWSMLISFLDKYMEDGSMRQISVVAVDDPSLDLAGLGSVCDSLRSTSSEELIKYRNLFSKEFQFVSAPQVVSRSLYRLLRESNGFTHRIASPEASVYILDSSNVFRLRESLLSDSLGCLMERTAPNVLSRHVRP